MELSIVIVSGIILPFIIHLGRVAKFGKQESIAVGCLLIAALYVIGKIVLGELYVEQILISIAGILGVANQLYIWVFKKYFDVAVK